MNDKHEFPEVPAEPYAFTVCRIEPENNLHMILEAFRKPPLAVPRLVAVGNWQHSEYSRNLWTEYGQYEHIRLLNPIYDLQKLNLLRGHCRVYLHGHSCGGTNPSLVEAMYMGLTVIAFDVNFNRETTEHQAWYFTSAEQLHDLCDNFDLAEAQQMAERMKCIADRRYTWQRISECYAELF